MQNVPQDFAPYQPPPSPMTIKKVRGTFLTVMLSLATLGSTIGTFAIVVGGAAIDKATSASGSFDVDPSVHHGIARMIMALTIFQLVQLASLMGMWAWKHLGVLGYFATTLLVIVASTKVFGSVPYFTIAAGALMLAAVFPKLGSFE